MPICQWVDNIHTQQYWIYANIQKPVVRILNIYIYTGIFTCTVQTVFNYIIFTFANKFNSFILIFLCIWCKR